MKPSIPFWLFALSLIAAPAAQAETLLIVGDSLSDHYNMPREAGWAHLLSEQLGEEHEVVNASISGETSAGGVRRIETLLEQHDPALVLIILGGNDGLRALTPGQLRSNLATMIEKGKARGARVALMQIRMPPNLGPAYVRRFEAVYPELAEEYGIELLPFFLNELFDQPGMMMDDAIHPTEAAQPAMLESVWPHVKEWLEGS